MLKNAFKVENYFCIWYLPLSSEEIAQINIWLKVIHFLFLCSVRRRRFSALRELIISSLLLEIITRTNAAFLQ
jgi:hypothetical protein